jgi:hypothetical protein
MRKRWVYVDGEAVEVSEDFKPTPRFSEGPMVIPDIQPYQAVAADVDGRRPVITSRSRHREFLKRNGYLEVGNEFVQPRKKELPPVRHDLIAAFEKHRR